MKKLRVVCVLIAFGGLAASTFADVQNIRISGDIRIRGYYLNDVVCDAAGRPTDTSFISQRTRVTVEADLEDHILAVVTIRAEGLWGAGDETAGTSGAGWNTGRINRGWDVGIDEAYVQLNEMFWSAATLKLGRQYLNYGHGMILSSAEQEYNFDAARLVLDFYPLVIDVVGAKLVERSTFTSVNSGHGGSDLVFVNARYETANSPIKDVEAYIGYVSQPGSANFCSTRVPPTGQVVGTSPIIAGLRTDLAPVKNWDIWAEGAYEFGTDSLSAWLVNLGTRFTMKDVKWTPSLNANYTYASGGGQGGTFIPWFDYGYNGYLFNPALANIHIFNLGASVKPSKNTSLALEGYYYLKASRNVNVASGANVDFGGYGFVGSATSQNVGWEIDAIAGYDYSKDVRVQLVYGVFVPDNAFSGVIASTAQEVRGEINVKF